LAEEERVWRRRRRTYASDVMEVMDTVLEVIADNPPSNPEYIELPKSEKKFDCKVCGKIRAVLVNSSLVLAYISNQLSFNDVTFSFRKFLIIFGFPHAVLFIGTGFYISFIIFHIYKSTLKAIQKI
jgi:hypothetical protein